MTDICDGCKGKDGNRYFRCLVKTNFKNYDDCPCGSCLVKIMCSEVCQERHSFFAHGYNRKEKIMQTVVFSESILRWWECPACDERNEEWNGPDLNGKEICCKKCGKKFIAELA